MELKEINDKQLNELTALKSQLASQGKDITDLKVDYSARIAKLEKLFAGLDSLKAAPSGRSLESFGVKPAVDNDEKAQSKTKIRLRSSHIKMPTLDAKSPDFVQSHDSNKMDVQLDSPSNRSPRSPVQD